MNQEMIQNRIQKNYKKLLPWAQKHQIEAFRIYDRDIPEFPYIIDRYSNHFLIYDKTDPVKDKNKNYLPFVISSLETLFHVKSEEIIIKKRERQEGTKQYNKLDEKKHFFPVKEGQGQFLINLTDYLDTGLFLDHRPLRQWVFKESESKNVLNLFCYTGSISVFAALGGGRTTSVDMSQTYLKWAQDNFELNSIDLGGHSFINANALEYLRDRGYGKKFDLIILDPPTFSNSKKMEDDFEVEKDQEFMVFRCMDMLNPNGKLYFSNNKRKFNLSEKIKSQFKVYDLSEKSIPQDFHDKKIHHCFEIKN